MEGEGWREGDGSWPDKTERGVGTHGKDDLFKEEKRSSEGQNGEWLDGCQAVEHSRQTSHEQGLSLANQVPCDLLHETPKGHGWGQECHVEEDERDEGLGEGGWGAV